MNNYFNLKKSKLLLLTFFTLTVGTNPVWAQKSMPYSYGFEQNGKSANARETFGQNRKSANAREVQSATTAQTPSRRSVLRASTDAQAPTDVSASDITGASATVSWNGSGDSYNLRYRKVYWSEGFESCSHGELPAGWTALDADGDGYSWFAYDYTKGRYDDNGNPYSFDRMCIESESWKKDIGPLTPDNWLISPQVPLKGKLSLWVRGVDLSDFAEHFAIYLSTTGKDVADFTTVLIPETVTQRVLTEYTADLSAYAGQVGYIAIRHFNTNDMYQLAVDNITIADDRVEVDGVTSPYTLDGLDGLSSYEVEVQAVTGEQQSSWSIWSTLRFKTLPTNATILYRQDFDDTNDINELGWTFVDNDGDGRNWTMSINGKYDDRTVSPSSACTSVPNSLYSQSYTGEGQLAFNANNWAITPAIKIYESSILSFQLAYGDYKYPDQVSVYVGETANVNDMTEVLPPTSFSRIANLQFNEETVDLSAFAGKTCYIAFRHQDYDKWLVLIDDVIVYTTAPKYDLTLADGSDDHGTVAFTVGGNAATEAKKYDVVTVSVTPDEGYVATRISAEAYTTWDATRRSAPDNIPFYGDIELTPVPGVANAWTFTMPAAKVKVTVQYAQTYNVDVRAGRFATFYAAENIQLAPQTPEGVALHTITSVTGTEAVVGAPIEGIVAANTPLLVFNGTEKDTTVTINPTLEQPAGSVMWADEFRGTATDSTFTAEAMEAADYYLLSGGKAFAMVYGAGTLSANQCWLQFDKQASAGVRQIKIVFGEETGISLTPSPSPKREGSIYSLDGRRVQSSALTKGVYVKDGRKVVIK